MEVPAHFRGAATGDGPDGTTPRLAHPVAELTQMGGQEAAKRVDDGGGGHRLEQADGGGAV